MIKWQFFPKSREIPAHLKSVIEAVFEPNASKIDSRRHKFNSNKVLNALRKDLEGLGFIVEKGKGKSEKIRVPVLFGEGGKAEKAFDADGWNKETKSVIEVEAGRGVTNYQFLKDLFQSSIMYDVDYLVVCLRNDYRGNDNYGTVVNFFNTLYASERLRLPLVGILVVGY